MDEHGWNQFDADDDGLVFPFELEDTESAHHFSRSRHDPNMRPSGIALGREASVQLEGAGLGHDVSLQIARTVPGHGLSLSDFGGLPTLPGHVIMHQDQLSHIQSYVQTLEQANAVNETNVAEHNRLLYELVGFAHNVQETIEQFDARISQVEVSHNNRQLELPCTCGQVIIPHSHGEMQRIQESIQDQGLHDQNQVQGTFNNVTIHNTYEHTHDDPTRDQAHVEAIHDRAQVQATHQDAQAGSTSDDSPLLVTPPHRSGTIGTPQSAPPVHGSHSQSYANNSLASPTPRPRRHGNPAADDNMLSGTVSGSIKKSQGRKKLQIKIPDHAMLTIPADGLTTPLTRTTAAMSTASLNGPSRTPLTPQTPATPGRIGPRVFCSTPNTKRMYHNLTSAMPSAFVALPKLPVTDTEIIVYFYSSISRPVVATRLYSRNWGPKAIASVLNDHRDIHPPYLANTCSVKCSGAIKKGQAEYGLPWYEKIRNMFSNADDQEATDALRLVGDELSRACDFDMRNLSMGIKKHPKLDVDGGIFTKCVMYCREHDLGFMLSNVEQLAAALMAGVTPPPVPEQIMTSIESPCKGKGRGKKTKARASAMRASSRFAPADSDTAESINDGSDESYKPTPRRRLKRSSAQIDGPNTGPSATQSGTQSAGLVHQSQIANRGFNFKNYTASNFQGNYGGPSVQDSLRSFPSYETHNGSGPSSQSSNGGPRLTFPSNNAAFNGSGPSIQGTGDDPFVQDSSNVPSNYAASHGTGSGSQDYHISSPYFLHNNVSGFQDISGSSSQDNEGSSSQDTESSSSQDNGGFSFEGKPCSSS